MSDPKFTPRVFSGIQPSGNLHLGNYLGALKRFVDMQDQGAFETVYCMVDLHAITVWQEPRDLRHATRELCAGFIAAGIDPERSILINQSQVPEHAQLAWVFNCVARMGWMGRMTQWKEKSGRNAEAASLGLFATPLPRASDAELLALAALIQAPTRLVADPAARAERTAWIVARLEAAGHLPPAEIDRLRKLPPATLAPDAGCR